MASEKPNPSSGVYGCKNGFKAEGNNKEEAVRFKRPESNSTRI